MLTATWGGRGLVGGTGAGGGGEGGRGRGAGVGLSMCTLLEVMMMRCLL